MRLFLQSQQHKVNLKVVFSVADGGGEKKNNNTRITQKESYFHFLAGAISTAMLLSKLLLK